MGQGGPIEAPLTPAAPATVRGERAFIRPLPFGVGRRRSAPTREPGDRPCKVKQEAVGCDGKESKMTTTSLKKSALALSPVLMMAVLGLGLLFVAGHVQSATLHDAAHDVRHATGFPCH